MSSCRLLLASSLLVFSLAASPTLAANPPTATELLARSIAYHDPHGVWGEAALDLVFEESRPDGGARRTEVTIDVPNELFTWESRRAGRRVAGRLAAGECRLSVDGSSEISPEEADSLGLDCATLKRRRDYYTYLWGLPMKLRDPGTRLDEAVTATEFDGREVLALRATYDETVGSDTWVFYFDPDPDTAALVGYRFFHDEAANDGEYITLEGEARIDGMRLPRTRAWYTNGEGDYLGTDTLLGEADGD